MKKVSSDPLTYRQRAMNRAFSVLYGVNEVWQGSLDGVPWA